jgi:Protein of unknown function (DUF3887)
MVRTRASHADRKALDVLTSLVAGNWHQVCESFTETMQAGLPENTMADNWAYVIAQYGTFESAGAPTVRQHGMHTVVDVAVAFEAGDIVLRVSFEPDGRIAGLFFLGGDVTPVTADG